MITLFSKSKVNFCNRILRRVCRVISIVCCLYLGSCATYQENNHGLKLISQSEYESVADRWTGHERIYNGLYNIFEVYATLKNGPMLAAQLDQNARMYQMDQSKYAETKSQYEKLAETETEIFISFFTPDRRNNDLTKSKTLWKLFLDTDGHRYEGTARKVKLVNAEIQGLYPYYNGFYTPYLIKFSVPARQIDGKKVRFTMTGPVGSVSMNFEGTRPADSDQSEKK